MRICSLLPGATEILFALGLGESIVGVTHECDYPPEAKNKPIVVRAKIDPNRLTSNEIDHEVSAALAGGNTLYTLDQQALRNSAPDLIVTQSLCQVCALDYNQVAEAARSLAHPPRILSLNPHSLSELLDDVLRIGAATGENDAAANLVRTFKERIQTIAEREPARRPRVVCLEWLEPLYIAGHWVPEIIGLAGAEDVLGRAGESSARIEWRNVVDAKPDVLLLMPCGFDLRRTVREATPLRRLEGWSDLPAVRSANVFALNGNAYFSRPGPRLIDGLEMLARILHPNDFSEEASPAGAKRVIH
ncbi:MAG TPA: cobalamin-binding protein [Candidatus Binatia bacterium]|nr:cobalamin-binding protein [Candidatus Binatia bacterium]